MPRSAPIILAVLSLVIANTLTLVWAVSQTPASASLWATTFALTGITIAIAAILVGGAMARINEDFVEQVARRRELEAQLTQSTDAEQKFWSGMSHDLRTPLNSILGYTELLLEEPPAGAATWKTDLERVKTAGLDLLVRINDLLAVSDLKAGSLEPHYEPTDVARLVSDVAAVLAPLASRQDNELHVRVPDAPCIVNTDALRLERVLLALATNAVRFTDDNTVTLEVNYDDHTETLNIVVQDTGGGFQPQEFDSMFEAYSLWQDSSPGFGLAVCKYLVEEMQGTLQIQSSPDRGSALMVSIPARRETKIASLEEEIESLSASPPNVLVVDENEDAADLLSRHLRRLGCHVTIAVDGAFGKDLAIELQPELIIMEPDMSSIDGWAVLRHLKYDSRTNHIPVTVCSSRDMRARAYEMGAADYLMKPINASSALAGLMRVAPTRSRLAPTNEDMSSPR